MCTNQQFSPVEVTHIQYLFSLSKSMVTIAQKLRTYSRQEQVAFEKKVATQGLEACCRRSAVQFSLGEWCQWLKQLHAAYRADLEAKGKTLQGLRYTKESLLHTCSIWGEGPCEIQGNWQYKIVHTPYPSLTSQPILMILPQCTFLLQIFSVTFTILSVNSSEMK